MMRFVFAMLLMSLLAAPALAEDEPVQGRSSVTPPLGPIKKMTDAASASIMRSEDLKEGLAAFIEKRTPQWKGR